MSSQNAVVSVFSSIPQAATSKTAVLFDMKIAFGLAFLFYIALSPFYKSRKSFWDAVAARKMVELLRLAIFFELFSLGVLLYWKIQFGSPVSLHAYLKYPNGDSWLYGFGRPVMGIILIFMGFMGDMFFVFRFCCVFGCIAQLIGDSLSAFQTRNYYDEVVSHSAPTGNYTKQGLWLYFARDIVSIFFTFLVLFYVCHLSCIVGWCAPPYVSYQSIDGGTLDRCQVMRAQREVRKMATALTEGGGGGGRDWDDARAGGDDDA